MYLPSLDSSNITVEYWNERISLEEFQWIPWWCWSCHCRCNCIQFQLPTFPNPPPSERSIWCLHTLTSVHTQLPSNSKPWKSGAWLDVILIRLFVILSLSTVLNWGGADGHNFMAALYVYSLTARPGYPCAMQCAMRCGLAGENSCLGLHYVHSSAVDNSRTNTALSPLTDTPLFLI